jgi:hypothetical protein
MAKKIRNTAAIDMTTSSFGGSVEMPSNQPTATDLYLAEQAAKKPSVKEVSKTYAHVPSVVQYASPAPTGTQLPVVSEGLYISIKETEELRKTRSKVSGNVTTSAPVVRSVVTGPLVPASLPPMPSETNGIEVTSVTIGSTTYTMNGLISFRGTLFETQRKILTVLYRGALENAMTAEEIHSLDTSVSVAQIKHHLYKDERLARLGLVVSARISGERTLGYRLTGMGLGLVRAR